MRSEYMDNSRILKGAFLWPYIIITYYKQTALVVILKSTQNKPFFEMIMESLYGLKLQQICAFICYDFRGLPLFVNYSNICHLWHTVFFTNLPPFFTNIFTLYYNKNFENEMIVKFPTVLKILKKVTKVVDSTKKPKFSSSAVCWKRFQKAGV